MKCWLTLLLLGVVAVRAETVSFTRDVAPIFRKRCNACHKPGKEKGGLDLTTHSAILRGGKHGAIFTAGKPDAAKLMEAISGPNPEMPKDDDPLGAAQVSLIRRWIEEGAKDDTPATNAKLQVPVYTAAPVLRALAFSPGDEWLAVSGVHEVILLNATNHAPVARLIGSAPRIESFEFSPDGKLLAVAAGNPGTLGQIQIWDCASARQLHGYDVSYDSVYGVHWSPDATRLAFGCADKTARIIQAADGKELVRFDQHSDWVWGAVFVDDGKRIVSGSRDRSLKLIDAATGALVDLVNRDSEPIVCLAKHPKENWVVFGSEVRPRLYKAQQKADNIDPGLDPNAIREFEHYNEGVTAVAFSPDGQYLASTGTPPGEVRVHNVSNAKKRATLPGHQGPVFALSFSADGARLATAGFEGRVRVFDWAKQQLLTNLVPVTVEATKAK